ncbi:UNVERIFIED_ORG: type II secretion protein F, partial [Bacillus sp. AZ43]
MTAHWPALLVLAAALLVWSPGTVLAARRRDAVRGAAPRRPEPVGGPSSRTRRRLLSALVGLATALAVGGPAGLAVGAVVAVLGERWLRAGHGSDGDGAALARELPVACDLLGVCLSAGVPVVAALAAVGAAVPAPLGAQLGGVASLCRLGAE